MTHFLTSSTDSVVPLYETISTSIPSEYAQLGTEIGIIDTFTGFTCNLHKVSSSYGERYVKKENVLPMSGTNPFPDYVCLNQIKDQVSVEPEWYKLADYEPFYNYKTLEYCITITTKHFNFEAFDTMKKQAVLEGTEKLLKFFNRRIFDEYDVGMPFDETARHLVNNYFEFASVKDTYVPYRLNSRIKALVAIPAKYFEAVPEDVSATTVSSTETLVDLNISKANFIVKIDLAQLQNQFEIIQNLLSLYHNDIYYSNSKLGFNLSFSFDNGFSGTGFTDSSDPLMISLDLQKKSNNFKKFNDELIKLLSTNDLPTSEDDDVTIKTYVELVIDDECNVLYAVALNRNGTCKIPRIGLDAFLNNTYVKDPTTIAFVKNIHKLSRLNKCDVSWSEFVQTYVYPKVILQNLGYNDVVAGTELDLERIARELIQDVKQVYDSIVQQGKYTPLKTYEESLEFKNQLRYEQEQFIFKSKQIFQSSKFGALYRALNQAGNFFDPLQIEKFFEEINAYISSSTLSKKKRFAAQDEANVLRVVVYNSAGKYWRFPSVDNTAFQIADLTARGSETTPGSPANTSTSSLEPLMFKSVEKQGFDSKSTKVKKADGTEEKLGEQGRQAIIDSLPKVEIRIEKQSQFEKFKDKLKNKDVALHRRIFNVLEKVGICILIEKVIKCILAILNSFIDAEIRDVPLFSFSSGVLASKTTDELLNELVPYLNEQDQKEVYYALLSKLSKDNREKALIILKNNLTQEQYDELGFTDSTSLENIYLVLADKMSLGV